MKKKDLSNVSNESLVGNLVLATVAQNLEDVRAISEELLLRLPNGPTGQRVKQENPVSLHPDSDPPFHVHFPYYGG